MPSARPTKEQVLTAYRRSAMLESARRVFGECGFEGATMERIAQEADVAKGTIYLYYPSKQSIYDAALEAGLDELDALTRERLDNAGTVREAIAAFIMARVEYFAARHDFFRMYVAAVTALVTGPRAAHFQDWMDRQSRPLQHAIARAISRREVRTVNAAAVALAIFDLTRGLVARRLIEHRDDPAGLRKDVTVLTDFIWTGLAPARRVTGKARHSR